MRTTPYFLMALALIPLGQATAQGEVFRWQDATGAVTFSDRKPPDRNADLQPVAYVRPATTVARASDSARAVGYAGGAAQTQASSQSAPATAGKAAAADDGQKKDDKAKEERRARALNQWLSDNCGYEPRVDHVGGRKMPDTYNCSVPLPREHAVAFKQAKAGAAFEVGCKGEARCTR
jgi:hypothetical protein